MTLDERYIALLKAARENQDNPHPKPLKRGLIPKGKEKVQVELLMLAAKRFCDDPTSASAWVLDLCRKVVLHTAMDKFYGTRRRSLRE